ncbi:hypothetical protein ES288_A04G149900v1 [Gossypium darwinii]|uniref:Uncharacterized protein n=1 Tax=Gossypium darwinii TaxID=34276 RepID=A0A5D2GWY2_GOSDA|nr:hypothetical protein ES288_A04G149900v1 [Gossypium darwinii]
MVSTLIMICLWSLSLLAASGLFCLRLFHLCNQPLFLDDLSLIADFEIINYLKNKWHWKVDLITLFYLGQMLFIVVALLGWARKDKSIPAPSPAFHGVILVDKNYHHSLNNRIRSKKGLTLMKRL